MTEKNSLVRRAAIQSTLTPAVDAALKSIEQLDLSRPEDARRLVRALTRIACEKVLTTHGPNFVAHACLEAVAREMEAKVQTFVEDSPPATQPAEAFPC